MVKPYCENCGKHRSSNPLCCIEETRRIADIQKKNFEFFRNFLLALLIGTVVLAIFDIFMGNTK